MKGPAGIFTDEIGEESSVGSLASNGFSAVSPSLGVSPFKSVPFELRTKGVPPVPVERCDVERADSD